MKYSTYISLLDIIKHDNTISDDIKRNLRNILGSHVEKAERVQPTQLGLMRSIERTSDEDFAVWTELNEYIDENIRTPENVDMPIIDAKVDEIWKRMIELGGKMSVNWYILVTPVGDHLV